MTATYMPEKITYRSIVCPIVGGSHVAFGRQFKEFGHVEKYTEDDDRHDVMKYPLPLFPRDDNGVIINWFGYSSIPLHG